MGILVAIAGVVTPLGLYQALIPTGNIQTPFRYLTDTSPFGYGTPSRSNLSFNRVCGFLGPIPCPFSDTVAILTSDGNDLNFSYPYSYDRSIPNTVTDIYSSGVDNKTTISNYFDIQWRRYLTTSDATFNNDSTYLVSSFRNMDSLILNNDTEPVEGLIVDTVRGGIGFRNHTVPPGFQYGVTWEEDLLFVEPESVCVDTNLTIDFSISITPNYTAVITDVVLTDRGGFVNINRSYPVPNMTDPQNNQDLWTRAYKAAWLNNLNTALYYNVTSDTNETLGTHAFDYFDSTLGKTYNLAGPEDGGTIGFDSLTITQTFGDYLQLDDPSGTVNSSSSELPKNPFNINSGNFSEIALFCSGAGSSDFANITNIYVSCGLMHSAPQRQDAGDPLTFDSGSRWSQKLYTCATAVKASIKTVYFNYNGTEDLLKSLVVTNITEKSYNDESTMPLWGVENTGNGYYEDEISLIWGLVSSEYESNPNVSTVRQPSLYLPGYDGESSTTDTANTMGFQNLPGSDFYSGAMYPAYSVGGYSSSLEPSVDYSGNVNMAMWALWQNLTRSADTASLIPSLIWTDNAASAVVGTKGVLGPGNAAQRNLVPLAVTPTVSRIKYHWPFAIPALLVALLLVIITLLAIVTVLFHGAGFVRMRRHLQQISPGRIYTSFFYPEDAPMTLTSKDWSKQLGGKEIDLSGPYPMAPDATIMPPEKNPRVMTYQCETSEENDRFLGSPGHVRDSSQGDIGGYGLAPPQPYPGT